MHKGCSRNSEKNLDDSQPRPMPDGLKSDTHPGKSVSNLKGSPPWDQTELTKEGHRAGDIAHTRATDPTTSTRAQSHSRLDYRHVQSSGPAQPEWPTGRLHNAQAANSDWPPGGSGPGAGLTPLRRASDVHQGPMRECPRHCKRRMHSARSSLAD